MRQKIVIGNQMNKILIFLVLTFFSNFSFADNKETIIILASSYDDNKMYDRAKELYFEALKIDETDARIYNGLGYVYLKTGKTEEAIKFLKKAIEINPNYAVAHNNLGTAYHRKGDYDKAIAEYKNALKIEKNYIKPLSNLAVANFRKGNIPKAIKYFLKAKSTDKKYIEERFDKQKVIETLEQEAKNNLNNKEIKLLLVKLQGGDAFEK